MKLSALTDGLALERMDALGDVDVHAVTVDSRRVRPGVMFVACPGATSSSKDGHAFVAQAVAAGASAIVVRDRALAEKHVGMVPVFVGENARQLAALLAERVSGSPSSKLALVGITGTNGKTTTTFLLAQIAAHAGKRSAVVGTLGVGPIDDLHDIGLTTPEAETVSTELAGLVERGVQVVAMEVSSIGLATARSDGLRFTATAFTNLTRDHLDFHGSIEAYFAAKARLVLQLGVGAPVVLPPEDDEGGWVARLHAARPDAIRVRATDIKLGIDGVRGVLVHGGDRVPFFAPLLGAYNIENLCVAAGCALALGIPLPDIAAALAKVSAPPGRLQKVAGPEGSPSVVVDYAHTPDALERALHVMRGVCAGKLFVVFGCGGDRDPGKRPIMGQIAAEAADAVIITDDNPRSEDGGKILDQIASGIGARKREVPLRELSSGCFARERARRMAIRGAVAAAGPDDVVLIAGKGHERTQSLAGRVTPFDDVTEARRALLGRSAPALIDAQLVVARAIEVRGTLPPVFFGVTKDSRDVERGSLYVALRGERFDGHDFVHEALAKGAAAVLVHQKVDVTPAIRVDDTLAALQDIAHRYAMTLHGRRVGLTGSNGKTTTKELIAACLRAALGAPYVLATEGNLNNNIGVPLTLLRAEPEHQVLVIEMGMNHLGEIARLCEIARPQIGLITNIGTAHAGNVGGVEGVAKAKAELFEALPKDGVAIVNADDPRCVREAQAKAKCNQISFGRAPWADVRIVAVRDREHGGHDIELLYGTTSVETSIRLHGRHNAQNAAAAVAVGVALGLPFEICARGLANAHGVHGRLERIVLKGDVWLLDDTYNANPDSMEAALATLDELAGARRRVIVLGEMRELGAFAEQAHRHVGAGAAQANAALLFSCGDLGKLYGEGALQAGLAADRFIWAPDNAALAERVIGAVVDGDVVLVKGSRGARMEVVVDALRKHRT